MGYKHSVCMEINLIECHGGTRIVSTAVNEKGKRMERGDLTEPMVPKEQECFGWFLVFVLKEKMK